MIFEKEKIRSAIVTGPTGAIGNALCRHLIKSGVDVYAVCRPNSNRILSLPQCDNLHIVLCDISDICKLPNLIKGPIDAFFHLAWSHTMGTGRNDLTAQLENVKNTIDSVSSASELGCSVFVGTGSQAEYGRVEGLIKPETPCFPENGYGIAKLCAGQMSRLECQKRGIRHEWARILSVYGPYDNDNTMVSYVISSLLVNKSVSLTLCEQKWDYLFSEDAAEALIMLAYNGKDGKIYPIGSGNSQSLRDYVLTIRDCINQNAQLGFGEIPYRENQVMHLQADISALYEDTGWLPKIDFSDGIKKTIQWMKEEKK